MGFFFTILIKLIGLSLGFSNFLKGEFHLVFIFLAKLANMWLRVYI